MALADRYFEEGSRRAFPTYGVAFCKLWLHAVEIEKSTFNWTKMDVAGHLVLLDSNRATLNMLKTGISNEIGSHQIND